MGRVGGARRTGARRYRGAEEGQTVDPTDMEALIDLGLLRCTGQRAALLTPEGTALGRALERRRAQQLPVDVTWPAAEPVLKALWDEWAALGGPVLGVPLEAISDSVGDDPRRVERLLDLLVQNGWVELLALGHPRSGSDPTFAPTPRAMQRLGGWPTFDRGTLQRVR